MRILDRSDGPAGVPATGAPRRRLDVVPADAVPMLMSVVDLKDRYTVRHSVSVGRLCRLLAGGLGWTREEQALAHVTGLLHDIGKIGVPDEILRKPGAPSPSEWEVLQRHPDWGADALARLSMPPAVVAGVRTHHERWDGGGYPRGLRGEQIPALGRVVAVCDAFHAMISLRPFRPARPAADAAAEVRDQAGTMFDPAMSATLLDVLRVVDPGELIHPDGDLGDEWRRACAGIAPDRLHGAAPRRAGRRTGPG